MTDPVVTLNGASFRYPSTVAPVWHDVDLTIEPGARIAITGPSGAGKSTLLNVLGLLEHLTSGEHRLGGVGVHRASERVRADLRARHVGFVFQAFHLLSSLTILENVALGGRYRMIPNREACAEARDLLVQVGLEDHLTARPRELSGGQQQRAAIARALAGGPSLLLCDEPTGNLDDATSELVLRTLEQAVDDHSALCVVTHDQRVAARLDQELMVADGTVRWNR